MQIKLTAEQRLEKAVIKLMSKKQLTPLFGVMMIGTKRICDKAPTAYTDGKNEVYGRAYVDSMGDKKLRGLMLHELGHKMFMHMTTWQHLWKINPQRANIAADFVVDQWIQDEIDEAARNGDPLDVEIPDPMIDPAYKGFSVQQVWDALPKRNDQYGKAARGEMSGTPGKDEHGWENASAMTPEEKQALAQEIDAAIRQGFCNTPASGRSRMINELMEPKVDWREQTRDFVLTLCAGSDYGSWRRPNRRFIGAGHYLPSGVSERVGELLVGIDTSGSIDQQALSEFLAELAGIVRDAKPERIRLLYWGDSVVADEVYEADAMTTLISSTKPADGGGTDPQCVARYIAEHSLSPQAIVMLTDGYVPGWGTWSHPVLWCIKGNRNAQPSNGKVVHCE